MASIWANVRKYGVGLTTYGVGFSVSLVTQIILARMMGAAGYGLLTLSTTLVLLPVSLADLGVAASTPRFLAVSLGEGRPDRVRTIIRQSAVFTTIVALLLGGAMLLLAHYIASWMTKPALVSPLFWFAAFIPGIYLLRWCLSILKGLGHNTTQLALESSVLQVFIFGFSISLWFTLGSVKAVVLGHGLAYLTVALIGLYCVRRTVRTIPHSEEKVPFRFREIISHGLPLNVTAIAQRLLRRGDILVLGVLVSESGVGLYRCAYTIASGFRQLLTPINSFAVFRMSKKFGRKQIDAVVRHYGTAVLLSLSLALPAYLISFVFADEIVTLIFGEAFSRSAPILRVLSAGFAVFVAVGPMGALFNTLGKNWVRMWMVLAIGTLNIILNITLINLMGLIGAAFATAFSFGVLYVVFSFFVKSTFLGYKADYRPMGVIVTTTVLVAGIEALLSEPGWAHLAGAIGGALIVMGGGLLMTWRSYRMKPDDQEQAETGLGHDYVAAD